MDNTEPNEVVSGIVESGDFVPIAAVEPTEKITSIVESAVAASEAEECTETVLSAVEADEPPTNMESVSTESVAQAESSEVVDEPVTQVVSTEALDEALAQVESTQVSNEVVTQVESSTVVDEPVTQVESSEMSVEALTQVETTEVMGEALTQVESTEVMGEALTQVESTGASNEVLTQVESSEISVEALTQVESTEVLDEAVTQVESIAMETDETANMIESSEVVSSAVKQSDEEVFANVECVEESVVSSEVVLENEVECSNTLNQNVNTEEMGTQDPIVENVTESVVVQNEEQVVSTAEVPSLSTEQEVGDLISQINSGEASGIEVKAGLLETEHMATGSILIPVEEKVIDTPAESGVGRTYGEFLEQSENSKAETAVQQQDLQLEMVQPNDDDISNLFKQDEITITNEESQPAEQVITTETVSSDSLNTEMMRMNENAQEGDLSSTALLGTTESQIANSFAASISTLTGTDVMEMTSEAMEVQEGNMPVASSVDPSQALDVSQAVLNMNTESESSNLCDALTNLMEAASTDNMLNVGNKVVDTGDGTSLVNSSSLMVSDTILESNKTSTGELPMQNQTKEFVNSYSNSSDPNNAKLMHNNDVTAVTYAENDPVVSANIQGSGGDANAERQYDAESEENQANKIAKKPSSFSLGVPGLSFSSQNVRVANDGTKLVQIHQSQITPSQLEALQANPNIKVVFRHIPSGKSFTKPPKNLFNTLGKTNRVKRKSEHNMDDSVYNFEDDFSSESSYNIPQRPPREDPKYAPARYNPNLGQKKRRGPGRPRSIPDPGLNLPHPKSKHPGLPAQMLLHEALNKLNKPTATKTLKIHISQVNLEILEKMELCPEYNLSLTYKHEVSAEEALKELAQEWAEKEDDEETPVENDDSGTNVAEDDVSVADDLMPPPPATSSSTQDDAAVSKKRKLDDDAVTPLKPEPKKRGRKTIAEEEKRFQESREKRDRREKEEAEIVASMLSEQTSRSGRKRKPTRFSLDIARLTKRYTAADDDFAFVPPPLPTETPRSAVKRKPEPSSDDFVPPAKRGRGRPRAKGKLTAAEIEKMEHDPSIVPCVFISLADQKPARDMMIKLGLWKEPEPVAPPAVEVVEPEKSEVEAPAVEEKEAAPVVEEEILPPPPPPPVKETKKKNSKLSGPKSRKNKEQQAAANSLDLVSNFFGTDAISDPEDEADEDLTLKKDVVTEDATKKDAAEDAITNSDDKKDTDADATAEADKSDDVTKTTDSEPVEVKDTAAGESEESSKKTPDEEDKADDAALKSTGGNNPSDILARKLDLLDAEKPASKETSDKDPTSIADFVEEEGDVDNKYRLRKLLQQCSIEEIISVAIPQALNSISIGDFFLYKSGQMSNKKVNYASMYKQLENLHTSVLKESQRYTTLLRRANKVGGDRRLDKVILMPVYNKQAAEALQVNLSSIDAHIGYIQHQSTAQMIAANSFRLNCKMEPPVHRLDLPDLADKISTQEQLRKRTTTGQRSSESDSSSERGGSISTSSLYGTTKRWSQQSQRTSYGSSIRGSTANSSSYKSRNPYQSRNKSSTGGGGGYMSSSASTSSTSQQSVTTQQQQIQQQQQQSSLQQANSVMNSVVSTSAIASTDGMTQQTVAAQGVVTATGQQQQQLMMDDGSIVTADEGKQLVSIGDGQYFELPEGYTLIQTDEGYIIGQPGATFVQGEDGNVYMTSGEEATEITTTDQMLTTTTTNDQVVGEANNELLQHLNQT